MIDHMGVRASDIVAASQFYDAVLGALGHGRCYSDQDLIGCGPQDAAFFWLHRSEARASGTHVAFAAVDQHAVEAFHGAGGRDNGAPGPRPAYGPTYFAAFLLDPDGNNIEAVCNKETA